MPAKWVGQGKASSLRDKQRQSISQRSPNLYKSSTIGHHYSVLDRPLA